MTLAPAWRQWPETGALVTALSAHDIPVRFVGGCVRDALLGRSVQDVDVATPCTPPQVIDFLKASGIHVVPTGLAHGTVTAVIANRHFEITTLRKDIDCDGRHANVAFTDDWREDAQRRDFTMNALYLSPAGELFDYFDGVADAQAGRVRFIGDPAQRIREDYLRILRFFRFHAHYGKGEADVSALSSCAALAPHIDTLSGERIGQEMHKLLQASPCHTAVALMQQHGVLAHALGVEISDTQALSRLEAIDTAMKLHLESFIKLGALLLKAAVPPEAALQKTSDRLKLSHHKARELHLALAAQPTIDETLNDAGQKKQIRKLGNRGFQHAVALRWASDGSVIGSAQPFAQMLALAAYWQPPVFPVSGDDLIASGMKEGKAIGQALARLEEQWEESGYILTKEQLLKRLSMR